MTKIGYAILAVSAMVLVGLAALYWDQAFHTTAGPAVNSAPQSNSASAVAPTSAAASMPAVQFPLTQTGIDQPPTAPADIGAALVDLLGSKAVLSMLQLDDFPRRVVATVDNLGRSHAPSRLWPINPPQGKFTVTRQNGFDVISADNGLRYTPLVLLAETVDLKQAVALYRRFYPQFQRAYADIGYPRQYFNDRLVAVLDLLLETPDTDAPIKLHLPAVNGPYQPERPWVLYEFDEPTWQSLTSGQKIMLRVGPVNERRLKVKIRELRQLVAAGAAPR